MTMRMLIDARHQEETRVAVVKGNRIEDFDFESAARQQIKGNIYLAKVARVEPSLQAAFIEYGGNRHGFLAFSEIHPDYYQIPREDRERLLREEQAIADEAEAGAMSGDEGDAGDGGEDGTAEPNGNGEDDRAGPIADTQSPDEALADRLRHRRMELRRRYKIQDVIKRRQVLLVQVVKEERGNKGAALTTYLSLAGRYCVLMPNTSHGGGISRKISSATDRKRLKAIVDEMALPPGMAAIVRTAGLSRTRAEIRRDFDYLTRLWDEIRETTLASTAPALIHEDSNLIKRAIRDIYSRDIEEVLVEGDAGYQAARAFMKLLMPSHAKRVKQYVETVPLFQRLGVEGQLDALFQPTVQLPSGGYMVINPTEALVSVDINSGRSTREHNIEETAYRTNLEAADEVARQLRLRDLAGLVVIDFIDMESSSNVRKVERALKKALEADRARIQVGRISGFGLLEMSRQRLRSSLLEASTEPCPISAGTGVIRTVPSAAVAAIRALEAEALRGRGSDLTLTTGIEVAAYLFNRKRDEIIALEARYGVRVAIIPDPQPWLRGFEIQVSGQPGTRVALAPLPAPARAAFAEVGSDPDEDEIEDADLADGPDEDLEGPRNEAGGARGRRKRGTGRGEQSERRDARSEDRRDTRVADNPTAGNADEEADTAGGPRRRRRRRRRGRGRDVAGNGMINGAAGMEHRDNLQADEDLDAGPEMTRDVETGPPAMHDPSPDTSVPAEVDEELQEPRRGRRRRGTVSASTGPVLPPEAAQPVAEPDAPPKGRAPRRRKTVAVPAQTDDAMAADLDDVAPALHVAEPVPAPNDSAVAATPRRGRRKTAPESPVMTASSATPVAEMANAGTTVAVPEAHVPADSPAGAALPNAPSEPPRTGWWRRTFGA